jgi:anaerobic ribonucleoside-triphosphate reductase activating protein
MTSTIDISRVHFPVTKLGPGERVGIWMQGCSIRCPGCISLDTWAPGRGRTTVDSLLAAIKDWIREADGFTISGGEPFDQNAALFELLAGIRERSRADILVFSGYAFETLQPALQTAQGLIDAIVTDPFEPGTPQTLALRGSDNQRLLALTPLGRDRFSSFDRKLTPQEKSVDVMFDAGGEIWLAGIPRRGDFERLRGLLQEEGAEVTTSQDTRPAPGVER